MIYLFRKEMKKWKYVLWAVFASLALGGFLGYWNYKRTQPSEIAVAKINGQDIKLLDFEKSLLEIKSNIEMYKEYARATGISIDMFLRMAGLLNPEKAAFDNCVHNTLVDGQKKYFDIELSKSFFVEKLTESLPNSLKDGDFINMEAYKAYLARINTQPAEFEERMERSFEREFFEEFIPTSNYVPADTAKEIFTNNIAQKSFKFIVLSMKDYLEKAKQEETKEEQIKAYYNKNKEAYRVPEKRKAFYWILNSEKYIEKVTVDESSIESFYNKNKNTLFRIPPKVKVNYVLFNIDKDISAERLEKILNKVREIKGQIQKQPEKLKEIVNNFSKDDAIDIKLSLVDFFDKGTYEPDFEKAAYRLHKKGDVSDIIKVKEGYGVLVLEERIAAGSKPLRAVRDEIAKTLQAKKAFNELNADIKKAVFESKKDKQAPLKFLEENKIKKNELDYVSVQDTSYKDDDIKTILIKKIFESKKKKNEYGFFIDKDDRILYQITDIQETFIPSLEKINEQVVQDLYQDRAKRLLKQETKKAKRALLDKSKTLQDLSKEKDLELKEIESIKKTDNLKDLDLENTFVQAIFTLNSPDQALDYKKDNNYYLVQLTNKEQTNLLSFANEKYKIIELQINKSKNLYLQAFIASLLRNARIEKYEKYLDFNQNQKYN